MRSSRLRLSVVLFLAMTLAGCESSSERPAELVGPDARLVPAHRQPSDTDEAIPKLVELKVPVPSPQLRTFAVRGRAVSPTTGPAAIAAAKAAATTQPTSDGFLNATQYYDYAPGVVYTAVTSPGFVTTIALRQGEKLLTAAAGDTTRWIVESVQSGSGSSAQTLLLVKPRRPQLQTNLIITTDQRVYTLDLTSTDQPVYHTMIAWNYPFGDVVMIRNHVAEEQAQAQAQSRATVALGVDLSKVNFNYLILKQKHCALPPWAPLRAFDDGHKTYIQFPPKAAVTEAPPLFVMGRHGDAQIVNYRVVGDYYVVDRLFDKAELRLGEAPQTIVGIQRADVRD
ncbi:MAG TPA: P-type conjugative transfer protein TrbG [Tepidisphaeraceae bacterium]|nr:P-type conjugative transfer protein TrbG [Tepidisphaeraceae bacterium]